MHKMYLLFMLCIILIILLSKKRDIYENFSIPKINIDNIYVLNLDDDKEKMESVKKNLQKQNLKYIRYPAINGKKISKDDYRIKKYISNDKNLKFSNGQKCCTLSHIYMWKDIIKKNTKYNIILEDDVIIPKDLKTKLDSYVKELPEDWDFLFLGGNRIIGHKYSKKLVKPVSKKVNGNFGTFAYLINSKNIPKILSHCNNINVPIDKFIQRFLGKHFKIFFCNPHLVKHNYDTVSTILNKNRKTEREEREKINLL